MLSPPDADLGGGLFKFRIARPGEGARGGGRALVALKVGCRAVLMFGWEKKDMENITPQGTQSLPASREELPEIHGR